MMQVAAELGQTAYVIPEGGSNGLGALGYVEAMREVAEQAPGSDASGTARAGGARFDVVVHACGSGGTAAGVAIGCAAYGVAPRVHAVAVCDDASYFERTIARIVAEARALADLPAPARLVVDDRSKGPGYGAMDAAQRAFLVRCARESGVVLDPVYTGKAMKGLLALAAKGDFDGETVVFLHTGGAQGLFGYQSELDGKL